jgi:uncharacterized Fe-S cluster protein YjdI
MSANGFLLPFYAYFCTMDNIIKKYSNGEVTVVWQPSLCIHSRICFEKATGLPEVFNPKLKPWIDIYAADTDQIIAQVKKCPTEALTCFLNDLENSADEPDEFPEDQAAPETVVQVMKNGPLLVYGNITVKDSDGNEIQKKNVTSFCRCGISKTNPYCDGSHIGTNFKG